MINKCDLGNVKLMDSASASKSRKLAAIPACKSSPFVLLAALQALLPTVTTQVSVLCVKQAFWSWLRTIARHNHQPELGHGVFACHGSLIEGVVGGRVVGVARVVVVVGVAVVTVALEI